MCIRDSLGWVWVPGNDWSPARVNWYTENDYIGWAPMAPPQASYPGAYQSGYENYWTVVPAPQFTRLNVGAYRTTPPRQPPPSASRAKAVERPPDIITIQGATHELIPARKTEQEPVSYTHLDVYKRQDSSKLEYHCRHNPDELHSALAKEGWE